MAAGKGNPQRRIMDMQVDIPSGVPPPVGENIRAVLRYHAREEHNVPVTQRFLEHISEFAGRPHFMAGVLAFVIVWIAINLLAPRFGYRAFDPPAFFWLQGLIGLLALLITNVVLMRQNRQLKLQQHREHLNLQISLLAEQKISKLIELIEQLRDDQPLGERRDDPEIEVFKHAVDPQSVLTALDETMEAVEKAEETLERAGVRSRGERRKEGATQEAAHELVKHD